MDEFATERNLTLLNQDVDGSMLTLEPTWAAFRDPRISEWAGKAIPPMYGELQGGTTVNWYMNVEAMNDFIVASRDTLLTHPRYIDDVVAQAREISTRILSYAAQVSLESDPASLLKKHWELLYEMAVWGLIVAFADINGDITNRNLAVLVRKYGENDGLLHTYSQRLSLPPPSRTEQAVEAIRNRIVPDTDLLKKYFWLNQGYIGRGLTQEDIDALRNTETYETPQPMSLPELSEEEMSGFVLVQKMIEAKALRADTRQVLNVLTNNIVDRVAPVLDVEPRFLETLTVPELCTVIESGVFPQEYLSRWKRSLWVWEGDTYGVHTDTSAFAALSNRLTTSDIAETIEAKGQVAYPGKVEGYAKLVLGPQHNSKIEPGDILVSFATSPQLLPAMGRAAAFVTAIGGITSHAAIVAREMKKPCIVGAKGVTHLLKDGDRIEVDAEKGTIRKL